MDSSKADTTAEASFKILDYEELWDRYKVDPDMIMGLFCEPDVPRSLARGHRELKVVSKIGRRYYNRDLPNAEFFGLSINDLPACAEFTTRYLTTEMVWDMVEALDKPSPTEEERMLLALTERFFAPILGDGRRQTIIPLGQAHGLTNLRSGHDNGDSASDAAPKYRAPVGHGGSRGRNGGSSGEGGDS